MLTLRIMEITEALDPMYSEKSADKLAKSERFF